MITGAYPVCAAGLCIPSWGRPGTAGQNPWKTWAIAVEGWSAWLRPILDRALSSSGQNVDRQAWVQSTLQL